MNEIKNITFDLPLPMYPHPPDTNLPTLINCAPPPKSDPLLSFKVLTLASLCPFGPIQRKSRIYFGGVCGFMCMRDEEEGHRGGGEIDRRDK